MLPLPTASILLVLLSVLPLHITGQSNLINPTATPPANFRFALGAWFDNTNTPASFNAKLGRNLASFQAAQSIPYDVLANGTVWLDPPEWQRNYTWDVDRWDDATDASVFMTIYADKFSPDGSAGGMDLVSDDALEHLAARLHTITTKTERTVYLRWLPEFNGNWMPYGKRPKQFVQLWQRMATVMRSAAPGVLLVWSPNFDLARGDAAYWPGADVVDVVGVSLYYKGYGVNDAVNDEFVALTMHTVYAEYAEAYQKPFVISECSAGWEVGNGSNPSTGEHFTAPSNKVDQATMQSTFWGSILNPAFFARFPLLHGAYIFEFLKEEDFQTDFRVTADETVRSAFVNVLRSADQTGYMSWASKVPQPSSTSTMGAISSSTTVTPTSATTLTEGQEFGATTSRAKVDASHSGTVELGVQLVCSVVLVCVTILMVVI